MNFKLSLVLTLVFFYSITIPVATLADDRYLQKHNFSELFSDVGDLSIQRFFQVNGLQSVTILTEADLQLSNRPKESSEANPEANPGKCHHFPHFDSNDAVISIVASRQLLNELEISFEDGDFRVESLNKDYESRDLTLQIRIYVDNLKSIEMEQSEKQKLTISLEQSGKTHIGSITAQVVNIDMKGHGSLVVGELSSESLHLKLEGHGKLTFPWVTVQHLDVTLNGHGAIDLKGVASKQLVNVSGHGNYNASHLASVHAALYVRGHARSSLRVSDNLSLDVSNNDNVRYIGNPLVTQAETELLITHLVRAY